MNTYEISYTEVDMSAGIGKTKFKHVVIGQQAAKNGLAAIRELLASKGVEQSDIDQGRSLGSNKRLHLAGITFEAKKV